MSFNLSFFRSSVLVASFALPLMSFAEMSAPTQGGSDINPEQEFELSIRPGSIDIQDHIARVNLGGFSFLGGAQGATVEIDLQQEGYLAGTHFSSDYSGQSVSVITVDPTLYMKGDVSIGDQGSTSLYRHDIRAGAVGLLRIKANSGDFHYKVLRSHLGKDDADQLAREGWDVSPQVIDCAHYTSQECYVIGNRLNESVKSSTYFQATKNPAVTFEVQFFKVLFERMDNAAQQVNFNAARMQALTTSVHFAVGMLGTQIDICGSGFMGGLVGQVNLGGSQGNSGMFSGNLCAGVQLGPVGRLGYDLSGTLIGAGSKENSYSVMTQTVSLSKIFGTSMSFAYSRENQSTTIVGSENTPSKTIESVGNFFTIGGSF